MTQILRAVAPTPRAVRKWRTISSNPETEAKLDELAEKHGLTKSEVVRQAIDYVHDKEFPKRGKR